MQKANKVVLVRYSEQEWRAMEHMARIKLQAPGTSSFDDNKIKFFRPYFNGSVSRLAKAIIDQGYIPQSPVKRVFNTFHIPSDLADPLQYMAGQLDTCITKLVSQHVIHPLLREYFELHGLQGLK